MRSAAARRQGSTMNSLRSALTAVRADPLQPQIRAKEDYECLAANSESEQTVYDVPGTMCIRCSGLDRHPVETEIPDCVHSPSEPPIVIPSMTCALISRRGHSRRGHSRRGQTGRFASVITASNAPRPKPQPRQFVGAFLEQGFWQPATSTRRALCSLLPLRSTLGDQCGSCQCGISVRCLSAFCKRAASSESALRISLSNPFVTIRKARNNSTTSSCRTREPSSCAVTLLGS
jgi:hypothetical protein